MYGGCLLCPLYPLLFFMPRERDYVIIWNTFFEPSILLQSRSARGWGSWSHTNAPFLKKIRHPAIFFHIAFPNSCFVSINKKQTNKQGTLYSLVWKVTKLNTHPVDSHLQLKRMISRLVTAYRQKHPAPCAYILANPASRVALQSCFLSRNFAFSRISRKYPSRPCLILTSANYIVSIVWRWGSELASWVNLDCKIACIFA